MNKIQSKTRVCFARTEMKCQGDLFEYMYLSTVCGWGQEFMVLSNNHKLKYLL